MAYRIDVGVLLVESNRRKVPIIVSSLCASEKPIRELDFSKCRKRHVALEVMYIGARFQGFARQDSTDNTIEARRAHGS